MNVLLIYSGKGGVGKSTISLNIAYTLKNQGLSVGLFDADLHTPSISRLVLIFLWSENYPLMILLLILQFMMGFMFLQQV